MDLKNYVGGANMLTNKSDIDLPMAWMFNAKAFVVKVIFL